MIPRCWRVGFFTLVLALLAPPRVWAAEPAPSEVDDAGRERALDLAEQARAAFDRGHFTRAAELLRQAYASFPAPELLYNLGRALESAGDDRAAVRAYERYLEKAPETESRAGIERSVANLKKRIAERERAEAERRAALDKARAAERRRAEERASVSALPWVITAAGAATLATAAVFSVLAKRQESAASDEPTHAGSVEEFERGERYATIATVLWVAGGAVTAIGGVWLTLEYANDGSNSANLSLAGRF